MHFIRFILTHTHPLFPLPSFFSLPPSCQLAFLSNYSIWNNHGRDISESDLLGWRSRLCLTLFASLYFSLTPFSLSLSIFLPFPHTCLVFFCFSLLPFFFTVSLRRLFSVRTSLFYAETFANLLNVILFALGWIFFPPLLHFSVLSDSINLVISACPSFCHKRKPAR